LELSTKPKQGADKMKANTLSFKNQVFFVGIDVHKNKWHVTIRSLDMELKTFAMDPVPEQLSVYLHKNYPDGYFKAVYEAGFCGFWIQRKLTQLGVECKVVNPADIHTNQKEKLNKTDKLDSRKLAVELQIGRLKSIHVPKFEDQVIRSLCRLRHSLVKDSTRIKNRIKGFLNLYDYNIDKDSNSRWSGAYIKKLEMVSRQLPGGETLKILTNNLKMIKMQIKSCTHDLRDSLRRNGKTDNIMLLMSVPGVGFLTAATLCCEIININRFPTFNHLAAYVGFIPTMHESAETKKSGELTPRGNAKLKYMLIEAAWTAVKKDPVLLNRFNELSKRMKKQKAIIKITKNLLSRIYSVWKNQTPYVLGTV
jgi:transposase